MSSIEWKDLFPWLTADHAHSLLSDVNEILDDAIEIALRISDNTPNTSTSSCEQSDQERYSMLTALVNPSQTLTSPSPPLLDLTECQHLLVKLRFVISEEGVPKEQIGYMLRKNLRNAYMRDEKFLEKSSSRFYENYKGGRIYLQCNCSIRSFDRINSCLQASYEEKCVEVYVAVELLCSEKSVREILIDFIKSFNNESGYGLEMQPYLEVRNIDQIFTDTKTDHENVDILWLGIGNMPNFGLFFIRGEYVTKYNTESNKLILNPVSETKINNATGSHMLLSWAHFEHDRRVLTIYFAIEHVVAHDGLSYIGYKFVITYNSFHMVVVDCDLDPDERDNHVYICLRHPPQLWEAVPRVINGRRVLNLEQCREWLRAKSFPGNKYFAGCSQKTLAESQWISFSMPKETIKPERMFPDEVLDWDRRSATTKMMPTFQLFEIIARWSRRAKCKIYFAGIMKIPRREPSNIFITKLPSFRLNYTMEALLSRGSVVKDQLFDVRPPFRNNLFFERIIHCAQECLTACEETLDSALAAIDERRRISLLKFFEHVYPKKLKAVQNGLSGEEIGSVSDLPHNCVLIRKVVVSPLRILLLPPEVMMTNRVVRYFGEEYALRCIFRDDNGQRLSSKEFSRGRALQDQSLVIPNLVYSTLGAGLHIASRHYQFLAWSNSQMRDGGCYMYSNAIVNDELRGEIVYTIEDIRRWMGDFTASKSVPKLMSRMGQCFTQAQPTILLNKDDWKLEDDIIGGIVHPETGEHFNFSDGVGRISQKYADRIAKILNLQMTPSCYQVRFKGFKGVLCVDPVLDKSDEVNVIFRKSQKKFHEDEKSSAELEIVKYSMPSPVCLNRPLVMILDQVSKKQGLHLHKKVCSRIRSLLEMELNKLAGMMCNENEATEELSSRLFLPIDFHQLHSSGIFFTNEPFFRSLLVAIYRYNIKIYLSKSKIFLPESGGRTMYGVVDNTGLLQYGQVFVQYSSSLKYATQNRIVHTGPVMVSKNPCHVAGDVRMFEAIYQDALLHLYDVIVFPRHGPRPHPDEMAGSDLDGDEYTVIFDKELFFSRNEDAMFFPKSIPIEYDALPTVYFLVFVKSKYLEVENVKYYLQNEDMIDFFLKYLSQDSVGRMSNAHLIMCDRLGLFHEVSEGIARKCAIAVDFPKTGEPADPLTLYEQSEFVPDYMQNIFKPSYRSKRLLGELYRRAKKVEDILELVKESKFADYCDSELCDGSLFNEQPELIERSLHLRNEYNAKIQQLLDEYTIPDEASLISGHSITIKRITEMEKDDYSFYHSDKIVELRYSRIFAYFRREFFREFGEESDFLTVDRSKKRGVRWNSALITKAKAWYAVTYASNYRSASKFLSFPWIVWDILLIAKRQIALVLKSPPLLINPLTIYLSQEIEKFCYARRYALKQFIGDMTQGTSRLESFVKYSRRYGSKVDMLCFVIDNWLKSEGVYEKSALRRIHAVILFLQFAVGILHGKQTSAELYKHPIYFQKLDDLESKAESIEIPYNTGEILFAFLRYLASEQFAHANFIQFRLGDMIVGSNSAPIFTRSSQWSALHAVAFRAFHYTAITARFDALHIIQSHDVEKTCSSIDDKEWDFGETEFPVVASSQLCSHKDISMQRINATLKASFKWSGVHQIMSRVTKREQFLVSCTGSAVARQRLHRILLMEPELLLEAIQTNTIPREARDEYL
ncbi:unnamed protein product [Thelazia callipaeda]|uniref:RNA-directed RNA polymerase n=1 Tax=Thelazia callipaeda TaxID=103827 RepID=A0A0N5CLX9_THECL|nr:unnamed protein product [Thelazia callipaeda]